MFPGCALCLEWFVVPSVKHSIANQIFLKLSLSMSLHTASVDSYCLLDQEWILLYKFHSFTGRPQIIWPYFELFLQIIICANQSGLLNALWGLRLGPLSHQCPPLQGLLPTRSLRQFYQLTCRWPKLCAEDAGKSCPHPHLNLCSTNNSQYLLALTTHVLELFIFDFYNFVLILQLRIFVSSQKEMVLLYISN